MLQLLNYISNVGKLSASSNPQQLSSKPTLPVRLATSERKQIWATLVP